MSTTTKPLDTPKMGIFSTSEALAVLWRRAELVPHEIEWFATHAASQIITDTNNLSEMLSDVAALIATDDGTTGSFMTADSMSGLMFNLSSQISTINGLAEIAADASYRVRQSLKGQQ